MTRTKGKVFAYESGRGQVAIQLGLSPKVVRISTNEDWKHGQEVDIYIVPAGSTIPEGLVMIEGHSID